MLDSLKPSKRPSAQCLNVKCGWSGRWVTNNEPCPRCGGKLKRYATEANGWRAFRKLKAKEET